MMGKEEDEQIKGILKSLSGLWSYLGSEDEAREDFEEGPKPHQANIFRASFPEGKGQGFDFKRSCWLPSRVCLNVSASPCVLKTGKRIAEKIGCKMYEER